MDDDVLTCLFWNMNRRDRPDLISRLAAETQADIVAVAEVFGDVSGRLTVRRLRFQEADFLLAAVHLPSKLHWKPEDQAAESGMLAQDLQRTEEQHGHRRTIVVGDLNMNPFEAGVVNASGLHAMMTRTLVKDGGREVQGRRYPFFYHPMWGFFGDRTPGPPGTYYYRHSGHLSYDWNMFDQVLIRPDALPWFQGEVAILTKVGDIDLLATNGRPDPKVGSDHLPVVFRLTAVN